MSKPQVVQRDRPTDANILQELLDLMKKYQLEFYYTTDDDGVHVACCGDEIYAGTLHADDRVSCHDPKGIRCTGLMTLDPNRATAEKRANSASGGLGRCHCDGLPFSIKGVPHCKGCKGCKHREEIILDRTTGAPSKYSPIKPDTGDEMPF